MKLELNLREQYTFDAVSLGEVMLRLDPGEGRIRTARSFRAWEGGGEYNVIRGLHKCFGMDTAVITAFADNEVGMLMKDFIEQGGIKKETLYKWSLDVCKEFFDFRRSCRLHYIWYSTTSLVTLSNVFPSRNALLNLPQ